MKSSLLFSDLHLLIVDLLLKIFKKSLKSKLCKNTLKNIKELERESLNLVKIEREIFMSWANKSYQIALIVIPTKIIKANPSVIIAYIQKEGPSRKKDAF